VDLDFGRHGQGAGRGGENGAKNGRRILAAMVKVYFCS
jgi:hypothetical protein